MDMDYIQHDLAKARMLLRLGFTKASREYMSDEDAIMRVAFEILTVLSKNIESSSKKAAERLALK